MNFVFTVLLFICLNELAYSTPIRQKRNAFLQPGFVNPRFQQQQQNLMFQQQHPIMRNNIFFQQQQMRGQQPFMPQTVMPPQTFMPQTVMPPQTFMQQQPFMPQQQTFIPQQQTFMPQQHTFIPQQTFIQPQVLTQPTVQKQTVVETPVSTQPITPAKTVNIQIEQALAKTPLQETALVEVAEIPKAVSQRTSMQLHDLILAQNEDLNMLNQLVRHHIDQNKIIMDELRGQSSRFTLAQSQPIIAREQTIISGPQVPF